MQCGIEYTEFSII